MKKFFRFVLGIALLTTACANTAGRAAQLLSATIALKSGVIETTRADANGVLAFKGIPYAAPPIGELRWQPPHAVAAWSGPRDASQFGPSCASSGNPPGPHSEDCLTLNVWAPTTFPGQRLPVLVWIPGGGFQSSDSSRPNVDGARLAAKGIVLVSFNYRVGVFGFLAHRGLDNKGAPSGNYGLEDQIAALRWVRESIERFGGDRDNVTIAGESTGGMSVAMLMSSPLSRGLFDKAIGESHGFWDTVHGSIPSHAEALAKGEALAARLTGGDIEALRALPTETLSRETALPGGRADFLTQGFSPSIDGALLPTAPAAVFAHGTQAHVPLLVGFNDAEGATFKRFARIPPSADAYRRALAQWIGPDKATEALRYYPVHTDADVEPAMELLFGDISSKEQTWEWMRLHRGTCGCSVYGYIFALRSHYTPVPAHTAEIDYVFGTLQPHWLAPTGGSPTSEDQVLSEQMMSYWANFVRSGNPNRNGLPSWPVYELRDPHILILDAHPRSAPEESTRFQFLRKFRVDGKFPSKWRSSPLAF